MLVYLNGEYLPLAEARVPVDDRGFLFSDGVYDVARVYDGRPFLLDAHLHRLTSGLAALAIADPGVADFAAIADRLLDENQLRRAQATVYMQVTRGVAPRAHRFPADCPPTVFLAAKPFKQHPPEFFREGVPAITYPDLRWARCDIKAIGLLPNVLANEAAHAAGAFEAIFLRDGVAIEGSHTNLFAVFDGELVTYPASNLILAGITRATLLEIAGAEGIAVQERPIFQDQLLRADEVFVSGTTTEVMPITRIDDRPVGTGRPGPVTRRLLEALLART
jgi:D-alanine transaminase